MIGSDKMERWLEGHQVDTGRFLGAVFLGFAVKSLFVDGIGLSFLTYKVHIWDIVLSVFLLMGAISLYYHKRWIWTAIKYFLILLLIVWTLAALFIGTVGIRTNVFERGEILMRPEWWRVLGVYVGVGLPLYLILLALDSERSKKEFGIWRGLRKRSAESYSE